MTELLILQKGGSSVLFFLIATFLIAFTAILWTISPPFRNSEVHWFRFVGYQPECRSNLYWIGWKIWGPERPHKITHEWSRVTCKRCKKMRGR